MDGGVGRQTIYRVRSCFSGGRRHESRLGDRNPVFSINGVIWEDHLKISKGAQQSRGTNVVLTNLVFQES